MNKDSGIFGIGYFAILIGFLVLGFFLSSCASVGPKAEINSYDVACEECQKYNSDLKSSPDHLSVCICK
jgi:hypothetical protein